MTTAELQLRRPRLTRPTLGALLGLVHPGIRSVRAQITPYAAAWQEVSACSLERDGPLWIALGDSSAQGIGASAFDRGYVGQLRRVLGPDWRVVNVSRSGARTLDVLARQLPALERLGVQPDLVTVTVGVNDLRLSRRHGLPDQLRDLVERLPAAAIVGTIPGRPERVRPLNELIRAHAHERGLRVAETATAIRPPWHGKLAADSFHPNDRGYAAWSRAFVVAFGATDTSGGSRGQQSSM